MPYLHKDTPRLALKLFRGEPAISGFDWNFSPTHTSSHLIATLFNGCACGPPKPFTAPSSWTWVDHPVSGLRPPTFALLRLGFPMGAPLLGLPLAGVRSSPDRSTKSTRSRLLRVALPPVVDTGFQVLFHSPPGVLFTFPSRYYTLSVTG